MGSGGLHALVEDVAHMLQTVYPKQGKVAVWLSFAQRKPLSQPLPSSRCFVARYQLQCSSLVRNYGRMYVCVAGI